MAEFIPTGIGGFSNRPAVNRKIPDKSGAKSYDRRELLPPPRPKRDFIPSEDLIDSLVERALAALAKGIYWDRGSIVNLVL
ncbi:MAG: hypothetical protein WCJ33_09325 [Pseudomonadota bacterium]